MVTPDRRRHDIAGRVARATYPIRTGLLESFNDLSQELPCRLLGHHWVEVPEVLRRSAKSDGRKMRFKCSRCYLTAGFTNR
jgi:hypothetical protein